MLLRGTSAKMYPYLIFLSSMLGIFTPPMLWWFSVSVFKASGEIFIVYKAAFLGDFADRKLTVGKQAHRLFHSLFHNVFHYRYSVFGLKMLGDRYGTAMEIPRKV